MSAFVKRFDRASEIPEAGDQKCVRAVYSCGRRGAGPLGAVPRTAWPRLSNYGPVIVGCPTEKQTFSDHHAAPTRDPSLRRGTAAFAPQRQPGGEAAGAAVIRGRMGRCAAGVCDKGASPRLRG